MKKFYSLILCAFMASAVVPAFAGDFVFWIDDREVATLNFTVQEGEGKPDGVNTKDFSTAIKNGYNVLTPRFL